MRDTVRQTLNGELTYKSGGRLMREVHGQRACASPLSGTQEKCKPSVIHENTGYSLRLRDTGHQSFQRGTCKMRPGNNSRQSSHSSNRCISHRLSPFLQSGGDQGYVYSRKDPPSTWMGYKSRLGIVLQRTQRGRRKGYAPRQGEQRIIAPQLRTS